MNISRKSWHYRLHVLLFTIFNFIFVVYVIGEKVYDQYRKIRPKPANSEIGLAVQYAAARKKKVCPLLTVVD